MNKQTIAQQNRSLIDRCRANGVGFILTPAPRPVQKIRQIDVTMRRVEAFHLTLDGAEFLVTRQSAERLNQQLTDFLMTGAAAIPVQFVRRLVALHYNVTFEDLDSDRRTLRIVWPRFVAWHLTRTLLGIPWVDIGQIFGGFDHGAVIHGCKRVQRRAAEDGMFAADVEKLAGQIREYLEYHKPTNSLSQSTI